MRDEAGNAGTAAAPAGSSVAQGQSQLHPESEASIGSARLTSQREAGLRQHASFGRVGVILRQGFSA